VDTKLLFKKHIFKVNFLIFLYVINYLSCIIDRNPLESDVSLISKIVIDDVQSNITVQTNLNNGNLESEIYYLVEYHFENCYGIINDYTVLVDTFGGIHCHIDYFQPLSPNNDLLLTESFWMSTDFIDYDSILVNFRLKAMFWEDSSFYSEFLGSETIKYSIQTHINR